MTDERIRSLAEAIAVAFVSREAQIWEDAVEVAAGGIRMAVREATPPGMMDRRYVVALCAATIYTRRRKEIMDKLEASDLTVPAEELQRQLQMALGNSFTEAKVIVDMAEKTVSATGSQIIVN